MKTGILDRLTVRGKLLMLAACLMLVAVALWSAAFVTQRRMKGQSTEMGQTLQKVARAVDMAREAQNDFKTQVQEWKNILIRGHDPAQFTKYRKAFDKSEAEVKEDLKKLGQQFADPDLLFSMAPVEQALREHAVLGEKYRAALEAAWDARDPLAYRNVDRQLQGIDRPMNEAMKTLAETTLAASATIAARENREMDTLARNAAILNLVLLGVGLVVGYFIRRAIAGRIQRGIEEAMAGMTRMAAGDFRTGVEVRSSDDLGQMALNFNTLIAQFQDLFSRLKDASAKVASGSQELSNTAGEVARTAGEVSQFAEGQREASDRTATAMTEFAASIREVSGNVQASQARTAAMVQASEEGARQGRATVQAMEAIRDATRQMVGAVGVIQDLARQTNLLALNAAIESAKAGQHGKGFAVVAEEVRKLAEHSAQAAKQIGELIRQTDAAMREGALTVEGTDQTLRAIQEDIHAVAAAILEIGTAAEEQARTSQEVEQQVQQTALTSERGAAASTELSHTVEEVNQTADHLAHIAEELSGTLARFQTA